jgi:hypothetical protein
MSKIPGLIVEIGVGVTVGVGVEVGVTVGDGLPVGSSVGDGVISSGVGVG